ncbi:ABC transporter substrate-binding protein [Actinomadura barringtoniae]|uniref:ABC transporter substrate-binding protein n=1 Tax=Actinomadura barringtoniae TaxID=1427535 RepID=A0A939PBP3_9ACTN|nr:ABC transporter substrate-binding protein [Actinomadura barringtoniae]MBO2449862.1 ABC transporter substrate-binding protein [Actinomadura barringtoniae]
MVCRSRFVVTAGAIAGILAASLAGCGGGGDDGGGKDGRGGTLRIVGSSDPDHLDPASGYTFASLALTRTFARPLFLTRSSNTFEETIPIQADVAAEVPTKDNGGISADGKTYTIKLRSGVTWNSKPAREVTAGDYVRGLKRLCNPASPSGGQGYYRSTILGMDAYCKAYGKVDAKNAAAMAGYQNGHDIDGLKAKDDRTLVVKLTRPAGDMLNILALQFASAAPKEYDQYVPDGQEFRTHTLSDGPYEITGYSPNRTITLGRNPAWKGASDPLRPAYVDAIQINLGQDSPDAVQQQLEQGTADLALDSPVPTAAISRLKSAKDDRFAIRRSPSISPFLVFNSQSPNNGKALADKRVRQAIEYAIDKSALVKIYGGPDVAEPLNQVIPPGNVGYQKYDTYGTPGDQGDAAKCKALLAAAGHPALTLKFPFRVSGNSPKVAQSVQANLRSCGVNAQITPDSSGDFYGKSLVSPAAAREGKWDVAAPNWSPDWYGNNGRSVIQPLFDGRTYGQNSTNYGAYDNPAVNGLIDQALEAQDQGKAADLWHRADRQIMDDAAVVPFLNPNFAIYHSNRIRNAMFIPTIQAYDYTKVRLGG